ncbi:MAG TPA: dihydroorotate dehydrogenase [Acidimicrobiales bacterium]|nr:dihydroorotate dehydrogenase [Acidimicrobiales bacterium]
MADLSTRVGSLELACAVLTASGTAGVGDELAGYGPLDSLGAVVVKSLAAFAWPGNPAPRLATWGPSMLNAVGLSGPGVAAWRADGLVRLRRHGATVVASIWGRTVAEFEAAAAGLAGAGVAAVEVNASCPNLEGRRGIFAHSPEATAAVVAAAGAAGVPRWAKLSPNTPELLEVAAAALAAGAEALVLVNTVLGMAIDVEARRPALGHGGGGLSGRAIAPIALRAVYECRAAFPETPIVGVGGITTGEDAVAMAMAGADALEVGTATFADPRAPFRVRAQLERWLDDHGVATFAEIVGVAHGNA